MRRFNGIYFILFLLTFTAACDKEAVSPIQTGGTVPTLFGAIAADEYMAIGHLDLVALRNSTIGTDLIEKIAGAGQVVDSLDVSLIRRVAFAVKFDARSWPNAWRAFRLIVAIESNLTAEDFEAMLPAGSFERGEVSPTTAYHFPGAGAAFGSPDDDFTVAFQGSGVMLLGNDEEMIMRSMSAMGGREPRLEEDELSKTLLLDIADMSAPGWFVVRMGMDARNLLQVLPPFENCVGRLNATDTLDGLAVFSFSKAEDARRMVAGHKLNLKNLEKYSSLIESSGGAAWLDFLNIIEVNQAGRMAIFKLNIQSEELNTLIPDKVSDLQSDVNSEGEDQ